MGGGYEGAEAFGRKDFFSWGETLGKGIFF
jgi:hypothetical protein